MFYDWDELIEHLRGCLVASAGGNGVVKCVEGASEFQAAFESRGDYSKPAIFVVPGIQDFEATGKFGRRAGGGCPKVKILDRVEIITVTQCPSDDKKLSKSTAESRIVRGEYFCCMSSLDTPDRFRLNPSNGQFIRQKKHQEYWWSDTWIMEYTLEDCNNGT